MYQQRQTKQRQIIETMLKEADRPLLPKELLTKAQESLPQLGIATVFRTLKKWLTKVVRRSFVYRAIALDTNDLI